MIRQPPDYWTNADKTFLYRLKWSKDVNDFDYFKNNTIWHIIADNQHNIKKQEPNYLSLLVGFLAAMSFLFYFFFTTWLSLFIFVIIGGFAIWYIINHRQPSPIYNKYYLLTNSHFYIFHDFGKSIPLKFIKFITIQKFTAFQENDKGMAIYMDTIEPILLEIPITAQKTLGELLLALRPDDIIDADK
jgi:hypothetical protein